MLDTKSIAVFWFRRDLRLHDNIGLIHALESKYPVLPIFIFDPAILSRLDNKQDKRVQFILQELLDIKQILEENESTLQIFFDRPENVCRYLIHKYTVREFYTNRDYEPEAISRDNTIKNILAKQNIPFLHFKDQVLFEGQEILKKDDTPYKVFTPFKKLWLNKFESWRKAYKTHEIAFDKFFKTKPTPGINLQTLGFKATPFSVPLKNPDHEIIKKYEKKRDYPSQQGTTQLGIHLRFGTVSVREIALMAEKLSPIFLNELIWREFYSAILQHFPYVSTSAFNRKYDFIPWENDAFKFQSWCQGKTGIPIVDAGMRQLNATGFMHNRVRMISASFLTKNLLVDWRWGEAYFASKLLDFDLASNNGGWQWAAGTGTDAQPYFRVFNPLSQAEKFDPKNEYINEWVSEYGTPSYPKPIVDLKQTRERAIKTYKSVVSL